MSRGSRPSSRPALGVRHDDACDAAGLEDAVELGEYARHVVVKIDVLDHVFGEDPFCAAVRQRERATQVVSAIEIGVISRRIEVDPVRATATAAADIQREAALGAEPRDVRPPPRQQRIGPSRANDARLETQNVEHAPADRQASVDPTTEALLERHGVEAVSLQRSAGRSIANQLSAATGSTSPRLAANNSHGDHSAAPKATNVCWIG